MLFAVLAVGLFTGAIRTHAQADTSAAPPVVAPDALGTFGFTAGETRDQIIAAVGAAALVKTDGDILELTTAPIANPGFDTFLVICPVKQGLVKLIATGKDIDDDPQGKQLRVSFNQLRDELRKAYGDPSDNFDFIKSGSTLKKPDDFMMAITRTDRTLATYWTKRDFGNRITSISLEANGLGSSKGYLSLEYEFAGLHDYLLAMKPKP